MPLIRVNRENIDDRFSVLGFNIRTESPLYEVGIATDPALFQPQNRDKRNRHNFFSSRSTGALRAQRGEATYLVPPDVLANFIGQPRLYFGLATYRDDSHGVPNFIQAPSAGNMYVNLSGLTERGLRRLAGRPSGVYGYGPTNGHDPSLDWGGDALPQTAPPATAPTQSGNGSAPRSGNGSAARAGNGAQAGNGAATAPAQPAPYDDGFGEFPAATSPQTGTTAQPASPTPSATPAPAPSTPAPTTAQALSRRARALEDDDDANGIEGPIPDDEVTEQALRALSLDTIQPEYPGASRFAPADPSNYRAVSTPRQINEVVIHITDGGSRITGTIGWFQNPNQRNARGQPIHVSAHYVVGQDGEVVQMVHNNDIAWHASSANSHSIGIEHVANTRGLVPTEAEYRGSAGLVAWLCQQYNLPIDRTHILGHSEADPNTTHTDCPNAVWDWDHYMDCVRDASAALAAPAPAAQSLGQMRNMRSHVPGRPYTQAALKRAPARAQEIIAPFYNPSDPMSALTCQDDAFSQAREEWFMGVPDTRIFPHSAICQLTMTDGAGNYWGGTGFYIGPNRILTCAHNLHNMSSVTIIPGKNGAGTDTNAQPFGTCTVQSSSWRVAPGYTGSGNWENDLAVIDNVPIAAPNGQWFEFLNATPSDQLTIVVCGYSAASDAVPELTQAIDGDMQHLHGGYMANQSNLEVMEYPIMTLHGASGSPVYHIDRSGAQPRALVCGVHVTGEPAAQGLNRGCFITPNKIDWIEGRARSFSLSAQILEMPRRTTRALANECYSIHWDNVPYYTQQTDASCWAAAAAMVVAWRDGITLSDADIAAKVPLVSSYWNGLLPRDRQVLADLWDLVPEPPASYTIDAWRDMLQNYGPLFLDMTNSSYTGGHAWVLVGMTSDGAADGSDTVMYLHNPWPTKGRVKWNYQDFLRLYEGRVGTEGNTLECQILHAAAVPAGYQPVTAAPFSLGLSAEPSRPLPRRKASARAMGGNDVEYDVALVPQPNKMACWAASMAMLLAFRRNTSYDPESLTNEVGGTLMSSYGFDLLQSVRDRYGFNAIEMPSNTSLYFSPSQWSQWLRDYGPLWVVIVGMPHAVVVSGLRGDINNPASCQVKVLNPWDVRVAFDDDPVEFHPANNGYADWLPFNDFAADFGNMAEPDYGNWRVLYLPASVATAQGLGLGTTRASTNGRRTALAPPPKRVRAMSLESAGPTDEPIEPSRVLGTTMHRIRGTAGRVTWSLDQLSGIKLPDPSAAVVPALTPTTITLDDWPCIGRDAPPLPMRIQFDAGAGAIGNVSITAGTPADLPYDVTVTATIEDDPQILPGNVPLASLKITIDYDFSGTPEGDVSARVNLRLVGNGRYDMDSAWQ